MSSGTSPARSSSRRSGRAGVVPKSSAGTGRALLQDDWDEDSYTTDSEADSTATDDVSSSSNTTFSEDHKQDKGGKPSGSRFGMILKFPKFPEYSTSGSCSNSELEDIYESDDDDETPVVEYDWDKLFAQGKKAQDESKLIRYVLPGDEDKLEDRLEDVEAAWPDYQQDVLTPVNSPTEPMVASVLQETSTISTAVTNMSSNEDSSAIPTPSPIAVQNTVSSTSSNEVSSALTTNNYSMASSTAEDTQSTTLTSKSDINYGSMHSRTQEILSQRKNQPIITSQPSRESMGTQDDWEQLFSREPSRSDLPPPYSPPRSNSLVAGVDHCPASSPGKPSSLGPGEDPLTTEPVTPPQPRMVILARQPSFDHGPRRSLLRDPRSKRYFCQVCMKDIDSAVRSRPKTIAWVTGWVLCIIGMMGIARCDYGCCLLPCCFDPCLKITHSCPYCEAAIVEDDGRLQ